MVLFIVLPFQASSIDQCISYAGRRHLLRSSCFILTAIIRCTMKSGTSVRIVKQSNLTPTPGPPSVSSKMQGLTSANLNSDIFFNMLLLLSIPQTLSTNFLRNFFIDE